jgi:hypothetical protein
MTAHSYIFLLDLAIWLQQIFFVERLASLNIDKKYIVIPFVVAAQSGKIYYPTDITAKFILMQFLSSQIFKEPLKRVKIYIDKLSCNLMTPILTVPSDRYSISVCFRCCQM